MRRLFLPVFLVLAITLPLQAIDRVVPTGANAIDNGNSFQSVINASACGDNIILTAGATYAALGGFQFGAKTVCAGTSADTITVRPASMTGCPAAGERVNPPVHVAAMPKLVGNGPPTISVNVNAHWWTFVCLEVTNNTTDISTALIQTANNGSNGGNATFAELYNTQDITFDRMFIHNPEVTANNLHPQVEEIYAGRGIGLGGVRLTVKNSWIGSFAGYFPGTTTLWDSYGIFGGLGNDILIQNNRIEAFFNNIFWAASAVDPSHTATISSPMSGSATLSNVTGITVGTVVALEVPAGTDDCQTDFNNPKCYQAVEIDTIMGNDVTFSPYGVGGLSVVPSNGGNAQWEGTQPEDITTTLNYLYKNPWWQVRWPGGAKDYIEVKTCLNCTYTANTFEGACSASIAFEVAQTGSNGGHPWDTIANNTFQNNLLLGDANGVFIPLNGAQASGNFTTSNVPGHDIIITNNLWQNITATCGTAGVSGIFQTAGGEDVTITHNTIRNNNAVNPVINLGGDDTGQTNVTIKDNIFNYGNSGFNFNTPGGYTAAWPPAGIVEDKNIVVTSGSLTNDPAGAGQVPNSFRVATDSLVGFVNYPDADAGGDIRGYALAVGSTYKGMGTGGTDPGVNMTTLLTALGGLPPSNGTFVATSCSYADVLAAKTAAEADTNSTITLSIPSCPSGMGWASQMTLTVPTTATTFVLRGAGTDAIVGGNNQTVIVDNYFPQPSNPTAIVGPLFSITLNSNPAASFRMYGITWQGGTPSNSNYKQALFHVFGTSTAFRVDHVRFNMLSSFYPALSFNVPTAFEMFGYVRGVIDHGIYDLPGRGRIVTQHFMGYDAGGEGDGAWAAATGLGGSDFLFIEDNVINNQGADASVQDCFHAGKFVVRFNTIQGAGTQTHPTGGSGRARGCRAWEIYSNNFTLGANGSPQFNGFFVSSGTGVIWGNNAPGTLSNFVTAHSMRRNNTTYTQTATPNGWGFCGTSFNGIGSNWDQNTVTSTGKRCIDQPGNGVGDLLSGAFPNVVNVATGVGVSSPSAWPRQALEPIYEWLNTFTTCPGCGGSLWVSYEPDVMEANSEYYLYTASFNGTSGVGAGTLAARPATCTTGVSYWATNQGSWNAGTNPFYTGQGQLFKCTATNTWTLFYEPYDYPHPLVGGVAVPPQIPPVPTQLTFTSQPTASVTETENLGIITVAVQDEDNATVTTSVNVVTVELCTGSPSGTLTGMLSVAAVAGIATFGDLKVVDGTGMDFSLCVSSPFLTGDTSDDFDVTAAPVEPPIPSPTPGGDPISGAPLPFSQQQFFNGPGLANVSGFVCTYQAGTTIPLRTYSDEALTSVNQNPIRLGVAGRPAVSGSEVSIFIEARAYKIVVYARGTGNTCNGVAVGPVVSTRDNVTGPNLATASNIRVAGSVTATGQLISEAPQGRAPIVVRSTTPVDNLVLHPEAYSNTGTQKTDVKHIFGTGTLSGGGTLTVTLSGASTFSGSTSYICTAADETTAAPVRITRTSGTSITFTGTAASAIAYDCIGN